MKQTAVFIIANKINKPLSKLIDIKKGDVNLGCQEGDQTSTEQ